MSDERERSSDYRVDPRRIEFGVDGRLPIAPGHSVGAWTAIALIDNNPRVGTLIRRDLTGSLSIARSPEATNLYATAGFSF